MKNWLTALTSGTRAIAGDQPSRRRALFTLTLAACILLFAGAVPLEKFLDQNVGLFVIYWLAVAWITLTITLLAAYDVLLVIAAGRQTRRELERDFAEKTPDKKP